MFVYGIGDPTPPPSICIICENQSGRIVDSGRELDIVRHHLSGTRMVCEGCIGELADAVDFVPAATVAKLSYELDIAREENAILREKHLEDVDAVIEAVRERLGTPPAREDADA